MKNLHIILKQQFSKFLNNKSTTQNNANLIQNNIQDKIKDRVIFNSQLNTYSFQSGQPQLNKIQQQSQHIQQIQQQQKLLSLQVDINQQRLSKYMSQTGICSRRQAEKMISQGLITVDGYKVTSNVMVSEKNNIKIFTNQGEKIPLPQDTKIYLFYKPRGLLCTHDDPLQRPTIFDYINLRTKLNPGHLISVGRLDFNSEGLILLTNNGELASCLENPQSQIMREYRVRVQGNLDQIKLMKIRSGAVIKGIQYGPFEAEIDNRQTTNTWLKIRMYQGKNREIRKVMQKYDLRVNRLKRLKYGCYKIGNMVPGDIFETLVFDSIKRKFYLHLRKKCEKYSENAKNQLLESYSNDILQIEDKDLNQQEKLFLNNTNLRMQKLNLTQIDTK